LFTAHTHTHTGAHYTLTLMCFTEQQVACTEVNWKLIFEGKKKLTGAGEILGGIVQVKTCN